MTRPLTAITLAVSAVALATASPAHAATPNTQVKIVFAGGYTGVVTSTGAVNAVGLAQEQSTLNPDGTFFGSLTFTFPLGTVTARSPAR